MKSRESIEVMPELAGRVDGLSIRVPTPNVSLVDLSFTCERPASREAINAALVHGAQQMPPGVMECNELPLVSSDFNGYPVSCVADLNHTRVQGDLVKVLAWYDNEWAFANRMLDVLLRDCLRLLRWLLWLPWLLRLLWLLLRSDILLLIMIM
jgi:glyceraldehyde 3-phosphate dehydrogenase